jgi:hypothetical protein
MSISLNVNGQTYLYPEQGDTNWGADATNWAQAVTTGMLQKAGGTFQLLAEVDFGSGFGIKSLYYKSRTANIASTGQVRLARADQIVWRNQANDADLALEVNSSNVLLFNGVSLAGVATVSDTATINLTITGVNLTADIVADSIDDSLVSPSAAIQLTKLDNSLTVDRVLLSDSSGYITTSSIGTTTLSYLNGVTSDIQVQLDSKQNLGDYITALTGDVTATGPGSAAATIAAGAVTASKLATITDGVTLDQSGTGSKLEVKTGGISNAQINASAAIAYSKLALTGSIVNADINASAAIAYSKLASLTSAHILVGSAGNVATDTAVTGDVTITNAGVTAIGTNKVANSQLAQMAQHTFKGNNTGSTANALDLTATQLTAELNVVVGDSGSGGVKGLAPATASGDAGKFLRGDATWATPSGSIPAYRSVTTTDTCTTADNTLNLSGASFTQTLYTAAGNAGRTLTLVHSGTSLTQVYTLNTTSAQTIGGIASGVYKLVTNGEALTIQSDGANWIILDHKTQTAIISAGTVTMTGTSGGTVTKATVKVNDTVTWYRTGNLLNCKIWYGHASNTGASNSGVTGDYLFSIPANVTIDTTATGTYTTIITATVKQVTNNWGTGTMAYGTSTGQVPSGYVSVYDSTHVRLSSSEGTCAVAGNATIVNAACSWLLNFSVPIVDWQP